MADFWNSLIGIAGILAVPARVKRVEADLEQLRSEVVEKLDRVAQDVAFIKGRFEERDHQKDTR